MNATNCPPTVFVAFFVVWIVLGLTSSAFFFVEQGRGVETRGMALVHNRRRGALFAGFVGFSPGPRSLVFVIPDVALITILNLRTVKFCDACGKNDLQGLSRRAEVLCPMWFKTELKAKARSDTSSGSSADRDRSRIPVQGTEPEHGIARTCLL
jgi:hypothetical protein